MRTNRRIERSRKGIASLELVMSFPFLVVLVAMMYTIYIASITKSQVGMEVRHKAWLARTSPKDPSAFALLSAHRAGENTYDNKANPGRVAVYSVWFPDVSRGIVWGNVVLTGTWDHRQVSFEGGHPHFSVLLDMVKAQGGVKSNSATVNSFRNILNFRF